MKSFVKKSQKIKRLADETINEKGLHATLSDFGEVHYTGSYALDLMLKKDLDITLIAPDLSLRSFFDLGYQVSEKLQPYSVFHRNTRIKPIEGRPPNSYYWAFLFEDWNVDLWLVPETYHQESVKYIQNILDKLNDERREIILKIKTQALEQKTYGELFGSRELYSLVLTQGVKSYEQLLHTLKEQ